MNTPHETFEAHGHTWTKHTPGDPMPCDGNTPVEVFLRLALSSSEYLRATLPAKLWNWGRIDYEGDEIIGWRYAGMPAPSELDKLRYLVVSLSDQLASTQRDQQISLELREAMKLENESMRTAIKEANTALEKALMVHKAITTYSQQSAADLAANMEHCGILSDALVKLQPFITPTK